MINWLKLSENKPEENTWILTGYWFHSSKYKEPVWCVRIMHYSSKDKRFRKVTHWSYKNPPPQE